MILNLIIATLLISIFLFINKNHKVSYGLVIAYAIIFSWFTYKVGFCQNLNHSTYFNFDPMGILMQLILYMVAMASLWHSYRYFEKHNLGETPHTKGLYFAALIILITAISVTYFSNHLAVTWIFVELTTLSSSVLIYHHRNIRALEGVWKYVFISAISVTFIYIGILFLSIAAKQANIEDFTYSTLYKNALYLDYFWLRISFLFVFVGFTVKLGLVPMFNAGIDAKDKAPAPAGALFSSVLMNVGFVAIYRYYALISKTPIKPWANTLIIVTALISLFVAAVYMTRIKNVKRMFAYSGIEQMSLVILGLAAGGIGIYAAILHVVLHTLIKPALFFQYNQIYWIYQSKSVYDIGNYFKYNKSGAIALLIGFISIAAIPPSGLFVSEFLIFQSIFANRQIILLIICFILLTIIMWGLGTNILKILFTPPIEIDETRIPPINPWESTTQYILPLATIYLAYVQPAFLINLINQAVTLLQ